jgi:RNA polymerase sigma-70 factor, ECF subfamily
MFGDQIRPEARVLAPYGKTGHPDEVATNVHQQQAEGLAASRADLDPESRAWLRGLRGDRSEGARSLERLHELLLRAARHEAGRRGVMPIAGVELDDLCHQAADDALLAVTSKLDTYRGRSRFTTWAYKFAVLEVSTKLRRHAWQGRTIPTASDDSIWDRLGRDPMEAGHRLETLDLVDELRKAVAEELTPRQRAVFVAAALNEVPIDVLSERLHSSRGAIYKVLHDARRKLRQRLERDGHLDRVEAR